MKKRILYYTVSVLILLSILVFPVQARAGGGGSSSGGGGSSSSHHGSPSSSGKSNNPFSWIAPVGTFGFIVYGTSRVRRKRAKEMNDKVCIELDKLDDVDSFWNGKNLNELIRHCYFEIQNAWSHQNLEALKDLLTPELYDVWQTKIIWQQFRNEKNILKNIQLIKTYIVDVNDQEDDDKDSFWVYIEGKMDDQTIQEDGTVLEAYTDIFVEYWRFCRRDCFILLDEVLQQEEFENRIL